MSIASIRIEPLGKDNFDTWKIQMQALLVKNDSWKYVNGTHLKPEANDTQWINEDAKAKSDLILAMSTSELRHTKNCETSNDVWKKLHSTYQSTGPARKAALLKSLILLKMNAGGDMRSHIDMFSDLVDKINEVDLMNIDDLLTILLLYSIPEEYEQFRIAIETQENLISTEALKIKLLDEYEARNRNQSESTPGALLAHKKYNNNKPKELSTNQKFKFKCYSCGKVGHRAAECRSKPIKNQNDSMYINAAVTGV